MTKPMRSKVRFEGVWYRPVPWMLSGECEGCVLDIDGRQCEFNKGINNNPCDTGGEFDGQIFIRNTKEAYEEYAVAAVKRKFDMATEDD